MKYLNFIWLFCLAGIFNGCRPSVQNVMISTPDIAVRMLYTLNERGELSYMLFHGNDTIVASSRLGIVLQGGDSLTHDFEILNVKNQNRDTTWFQPWGETKQVRDTYTTLALTMRHKPSNRKMIIRTRMYNECTAFRYEFPEEDSLVIVDEITEINFTKNPTMWWSMADFNTYEKSFNRTSADSMSWAAVPFIGRRADGLHIAVNEAAVVNYPDMTLKNMGAGLFKTELTPWQNGVKAYVKAPFETPWRMIHITSGAAQILQSQAMVALNAPNRLEGASWIKPMTYIGIWWTFHLGTGEWKEGNRQAATTAETMRYIDFAAENRIGGVVVEGWNKGWDKWGEKDAFDYVTPANNYDLRRVAAYAKEKGVELIMHHETGADIEGYESLMDSAMSLCRELGIHALKTGHAGGVSTGENHHGQQMVEHFYRIAQKAAKYELMLDLHEPVKGSGINRTYPNIMTREAVRGMEWEAWSLGNSPSHTTTIPFVRGLSGATDYTPGIFDILLKNARGRQQWNGQLLDISGTRVHSTLVHQLALMVTIYSPMVMAADVIDNYAGHPAFEFVRDLNPDYDESLVVDASIGDYIATARRTGDVWYLAATTNEQGRDISIPLSFLGEGRYVATQYLDGEQADWVTNPTDYRIVKQDVDKGSTLDLKLAPGGGAAVVFKKIE